jgi:hypothetical protein
VVIRREAADQHLREEPPPSRGGSRLGENVTIRGLAGDAAVLVGLAGVAITQPLLSLLGDNPTFFVAGGYRRSQIVWFALVVAFAPGFVVFVASALPGILSRRLDRPAHAVGVGVLAGLFAVMVCRTIRVDGVLYVAVAVGVVGAAVALAERRLLLARRFLSYLAVGNVVFLALFLVASPTAELVLPSADGIDQGDVVVPPLDGPVVLVVLDEFPLTSLIRADGTINETRYPNFARLAEQSNWFRDAASESYTTYVSTPTIMSGRVGEGRMLPTLENHPRNYLTLFGSLYPVNRYEMVTDMCPSGVCERRTAGSFEGLLDDGLTVYQHRVLPPEMRTHLPPIDAGWGDFTATFGAEQESVPPTPRSETNAGGNPYARLVEHTPKERSGAAQAAAFLRQISLLDADPTVNFIHVTIPHHPYVLTPWGSGDSPTTWMPDNFEDERTKLPAPDDPAYDFAFRQVYALQAMQIGAVDLLIGDMIDRLVETGAWDDALVVVTSDHGIDATSPGFVREEDGVNADELYRIPLFIKAPGQSSGAIRDDPASTLDVLPSIVDLLGIDTTWDFDGHSLFDGSEPHTDRLLTTGFDAAMAVAAGHSAQYPRGEGWPDLAAVGEGEDLVGDVVELSDRGEASELRWSLDAEELLVDLSVEDGPVPYLLRGTVAGTDDRPPELVVSVNGTIAGTVGGYVRTGDGWRFSGVMGPWFTDGRNKVIAYEVERRGATITLHPLVT